MLFLCSAGTGVVALASTLSTGVLASGLTRCLGMADLTRLPAGAGIVSRLATLAADPLTLLGSPDLVTSLVTGSKRLGLGSLARGRLYGFGGLDSRRRRRSLGSALDGLTEALGKASGTATPRATTGTSVVTRLPAASTLTDTLGTAINLAVGTLLDGSLGRTLDRSTSEGPHVTILGHLTGERGIRGPLNWPSPLNTHVHIFFRLSPTIPGAVLGVLGLALGNSFGAVMIHSWFLRVVFRISDFMGNLNPYREKDRPGERFLALPTEGENGLPEQSVSSLQKGMILGTGADSLLDMKGSILTALGLILAGAHEGATMGAVETETSHVGV